MAQSVLNSSLSQSSAPGYMNSLSHMDPPPPSKSPIEPASLGGPQAGSSDTQGTGKIGRVV